MRLLQILTNCLESCCHEFICFPRLKPRAMVEFCLVIHCRILWFPRLKPRAMAEIVFVNIANDFNHWEVIHCRILWFPRLKPRAMAEIVFVNIANGFNHWEVIYFSLLWFLRLKPRAMAEILCGKHSQWFQPLGGNLFPHLMVPEVSTIGR